MKDLSDKKKYREIHLKGLSDKKVTSARDLGQPSRGRRAYVLAAIGLACVLGGCNQYEQYRTAERLDRGLVIVLTGIEGRSAINDAIVKGLDAGGVDWAIELIDWTVPWAYLYNLRAEVHNRRKAAGIAERIARYHWDYPDRPVVLIGQSGGGAIAVWIAENMMLGHSVDGVILLAVALSPEYALDFALEKSRRGIVNFYSERDVLFLAAGTTVYGTMDGRHVASAGQASFKIPEDPGGAKAYENLFQVAWSPEMSSTGHAGVHLTSGADRFIARYVAPLVTARPTGGAWNAEYVDDVIHGLGTYRRGMFKSQPAPASDARQVRQELYESRQ